MKDIKLSEKQKEVVREMRKGRRLVKWVVGVDLTGGVNVSTPTFFALIRCDLILPVDLRKSPVEYRLTELGKTIKL